MHEISSLAQVPRAGVHRGQSLEKYLVLMEIRLGLEAIHHPQRAGERRARHEKTCLSQNISPA
jgi:hypothetical protein